MLVDLPVAALAETLAVFAANVLSPGPNVLNTMAVSMAQGRAAGVAAALGVALGVAWWAALALLGAAALFAAWPSAERLLSGLGGALLLWFAARYARRAAALWRAPMRVGAKAAANRTHGAIFAEALAIQLANPKAMTTWLVLIAVFPTAEADVAALAALALGAMAVALFGHVGYAVIFSTAAAARAYAWAAPAVIGAVALFFGALGLGLIAKALSVAPA